MKTHLIVFTIGLATGLFLGVKATRKKKNEQSRKTRRSDF